MNADDERANETTARSPLVVAAASGISKLKGRIIGAVTVCIMPSIAFERMLIRWDTSRAARASIPRTN